MQSRLHEPLRVAIVGQVSAGKSTVVNALLERKVAPTAAGECTRVVTWYSAGNMEGAEVRPLDGEVRTIGLPGGRLPEDVGINPESIDSIRVRLQNERLREITVIDTPGLESANEERSSATESFLGVVSKATVAEADAVIYVFNQPPGAADQRVLGKLRSQLSQLRISAFNAIGALNMSDRLGGIDDVELDEARRIASGYETSFSTAIAAIIPTVGLLGETAAAELRESHVDDLQALAAESPASRQRMLLAGDMFLGAECSVPVKRRQELLDLLDLYGLARAFECVDDGVRTAADLQQRFLELSGVRHLREFVTDNLARRADALKAHAAVQRLRQFVYSANGVRHADIDRVRSELADLLLDPRMQVLETAWALQQVASGRVLLRNPELEEDIRRVAIGTSVNEKLGALPDVTLADQEQLISNRADAWSRLAATTSDWETRKVAEILWKAHQHLFAEVSA